MTQIADVLHIRRAARHRRARRHEEVRSGLPALQHHALEAYFFPLVAIRIILKIHEEDSIVHIINIDNILIQIIGNRILKDIHRLSVHVQELHITARIHYLKAPAEIGEWHIPLAAIEQHHIRLPAHLREQGLHVGLIDLECRCIHCHDLLHNAPSPGKPHLPELVHAPQRVEFDNHTLRAVFSLKRPKVLIAELLLFIDRLDHCIVLQQFLFIVFLFPFLCIDQKGRPVDLEIILGNRKIQERCLSTFQKSRDQINRDFDFILIHSFSFLYYMYVSQISICFRISISAARSGCNHILSV